MSAMRKSCEEDPYYMYVLLLVIKNLNSLKKEGGASTCLVLSVSILCCYRDFTRKLSVLDIYTVIVHMMTSISCLC